MLLEKEKVTEKQQFINKLFSNFKGYIEIREIDSSNKVKQKFFKYHDLTKYNPPQDVNVYAGIFERKTNLNGTAANTGITNAIYLDFDNMPLEAVKYTIDTKGLPYPSMIVSSGYGFHVYYMLDQPANNNIQPLIEAMAKALNADLNAIDVARVLRLPETNNIKHNNRKKVEIVEVNEYLTSIKELSNLLDIDLKAPLKASNNAVIKELANIKVNGINNMAKGVGKGKRNFAAGRIIQTLKRLNFTKQEIKDIIFRWNKLNTPEKAKNELINELNTFYHDERYKYDGKTFKNERLEALNLSFIDKDTSYFIHDDDSFNHYDNELLNPENFKKASGLTFAVLAVIKLAESEGIRREHIADLTKRHQQDNKLKESLNMLHKLNYITIKKVNRVNYYIFTEKGNYNRGFTSVSKSLHRSFIYKELNEPQYKLVILLESYAYENKKIVYPNANTLALRLDQTVRNVRRNLKRLEHLQFIKRYQEQGNTIIRFIYR